LNEYIIISFFLLLGTIIAGGAILVGKLISVKTPLSNHKHSAYECGAEPWGNARIQFKVGYYLYALLFLIFDIEALFLFPALKIFQSVIQGEIPGVSVLLIVVELAVFVFVLLSGLIYAWKKGALKWE
jgi:NADH-quinone oxidoreductase subunit A